MEDDALPSSSPFASQEQAEETPRHMPSFSTSRRSSGRGTPSSFAPPTPPPLPDGVHSATKEPDQEDDLGPLDPRRLTPNLHANLVSEILSLRREIESKDTFIDRLEGNLASVKSESESLEVQLAKKSKETRTIKRQLQSIEDGTLSALEELCKERDEANESVTDLRKRLDASQRQLKAEQDSFSNARKTWDEEKSKLELDKRVLQRKNDLAEARLKAVAEELGAFQPNGEPVPIANVSSAKDFADSANSARVSLPTSPTAVRSHRRNQSSVSTVGSVQRDSLVNGVTLADELDTDDEDVASDADFDETYHKVAPENGDQRAFDEHDGNERDIVRLPNIHESDEGLANSLESVPNGIATSDAPLSNGNETDRNVPSVERPSSVLAQEFGRSEESALSNEDNLTQNQDSTALEATSYDPDVSEHVTGLESGMISSERSVPIPALSSISGNDEEEIAKTASSSAQTEPNASAADESKSSVAPSRAPPPAPITVPQIAIHPPESGPSSPSETVLPPRTRSISTQTYTELAGASRSIAVQTDVIRVDLRRFTLPPHLLPSALDATEASSRDPSVQVPSAKLDEDRIGRAISPLPSPTDLESPETQLPDQSTNVESVEQNTYDNSWARFRKNLMSNARPTRASETDPFQGNEEAWMSEGDYIPPVPASRAMKRPQKLGKPFDPPTPVPEDEKVVIPQHSNHSGQPSASSNNIRSGSFGAASKGKHGRRVSDRSGSPSSRASSSAWSRSTGPPPGIVIPQRTSSVAIRHSRLDGSISPTRRAGNSKRIGKPPMLRKIRSASVISSENRNDPSRSFPLSPYSQASFASGETSPAPVPEHSVLQIYHAGHQRSSSSQTRRLSSVHPTGNASCGTSVQHSVVDAIAATMIGEWMWKYVRKRKSFGMSDPSQEATKAGDQKHKRWVWLSPYERTVMWSAKQPTSNASLMGKSGRKLTIQSVLDVKDDKLVPKGTSSDGVFNRSILILTPSRALKFTATTRERHYLWLTALSFLAHHTSRGSLDLSFLPRSITATPHNEVDPNVSRTTSATASRSGRKPWSSRTTNRSQQSSGYATPSIPEASVSAEGGTVAAPPKPTRPAPQAPGAETFPSDAALPPTIPRVPGSRNTSMYFGMPTKHGRKRSASITGVMSLSSRPSSRRLQANGTSYPNTAATNSSNHSTKSGINVPTTSSTRNSANTADPPPAVPSTAGVAAKYNGVPPVRRPTTPVRDDAEPDPATLTALPSLRLGDTQDFDRAVFADLEGDASTEFGGNNNFFDAVGADMGPTGTGVNVRRADAFSGPGFERGPPKRPPPPPPDAEAPSNAFQRHTTSESIDSVAPPPIRFHGVSSSNTADAQHQNQDDDDEAGVAAAKPIEKKPYNPPQRKLPRWGLGRNAANKKEAAPPAPNVAAIAATVAYGEDKENIAS